MKLLPLSFRECMLLGGGLSLTLLSIACAVYWMGGASDLRAAGVGYVEMIVVYLVLGLGGAIVFWKIQSLVATRLGSALVGFLVLVPAALTFAALVPDSALPAAARYPGAVLAAALLGGMIGFEEGGH